MTPKIAVILFPGTNCELEALRALKRSDMTPELIRWNDTDADYSSFDGFFIPGGFSYEDRGRSGIIASKNPLLEKVREEAGKGKPVLGVCNGAQIVLESKLIPGLDPKHVEMSLAWNKRVDKDGNILGTGFYNDWIYIKNTAPPGRSAFNKYDSDHILKIPIAHAEGRYTTLEQGRIDIWENNEQLVFKYCDKNGEILNEFPINPNGAIANLAGICNPEGNVMSLMPHPERTEKGQAIFDSMRDYIGKSFSITKKDDVVAEKESEVKDEVKEYEKKDIEIYVDSIITDNEERTVEKAIHDMDFKELRLKKQLYYGIKTSGSSDLKETANALIKTGEIVNLSKEVPTIIIEDKKYSYDKDEGLFEITDSDETTGVEYLTIDKEDTVGESISQTLEHHFSIPDIMRIYSGKKWILSVDREQAKKIVQTQIFHNPHAMDIYKA